MRPEARRQHTRLRHSLPRSLAAHAARSAGRQARKSNSTRHHGAPPPAEAVWSFDKKRPGLDDMTLLTKPTPQGIRDNLKERLEAECIYTYIGARPSRSESLHVAADLLF